MEDLNKISSTRVGDNIHFYVNGAEDKGVVVKMDTGYVTVLKDNGDFQDIHINDTFFIKDILVNKTWNDMNMEERTVKLHEIKAYSPRFLAKSWQELPRELKVVLENTAKDALTADERIYSGKENNALPADSKQSHQESSEAAKRPASGQGTHNSEYSLAEHGREMRQKPASVLFANEHNRHWDGSKNTGAPAGEKIGDADDRSEREFKTIRAVDDAGGHPYDKGYLDNPLRREGGSSPKDMEVKKSNVEQGHYGSAGRASHVVETNTDFDAPDDYEGQTEDEKKEQFKHEAKKPQTTNKTSQEQLWEDWLEKGFGKNEGDTSPSKHRNEDKLINEFQEHVRRKFPGKQNRRGTLEREHGDQVRSTIEERKPSPQGDIAKESMGGGDSSPAQTSITTGTTGMYNAVYGKDGRIKGQEKDKDEEETEKDKEEKEKERKG